jgi:hypothetical protein
MTGKGTRLHVDLCTGLGGWTQPFRDAETWRTVGLDVRADLNADVVADVRHLPFDCDPDLVTASPPCIEFTKWKLPWYGDGACSGDPSMELVEACLAAIEELDPQYWVLENVVGLHMYWKPARKHVGPYYLWGDFPPFDAETVYKDQRFQPKDRRSELSAKIPYHVADALRQSVEVYA